MTRILVTDSIAGEGLDYLRSEEGFEILFAPDLPETDLKEAIRDADGLIVRSGTEVTAEVLSSARRLRVIGRAGVGVDNIDVDAATERGVVVLNTPDANAISAAELTVAHMLALARHLPRADREVRSGSWSRGHLIGNELNGKTVGVIGFGAIGRLVAERARGLGMKVLGHDPFIPAEVFRQQGVEAVDLNHLLGRADYVTLHCPLNDRTRGLIGAQELAEMKPAGRLINCARGGLIDEAALYEALAAGRIAGAGLDVFEQEPPAGSPLLELENIVLTPHLGASTREAQLAVGLAIARQVASFLQTGEATGAVNVPVVSATELAQVQPYMALARRLGRLLAFLAERPIRELEVSLQGRAARVTVHPVDLAAGVGLLSAILDVTVNEVNAPSLATRQGIRLVESRSVSAEDYVALVTLTGRHGEGEMSVAGALLGEKHPRLVRIDDFQIEAVPEGTLLITRHDDMPGVVGALGSLLGAEGVNISGMQVGLSPEKLEAIAVLGISQRLSPELLRRVSAIPAIRQVLQVEL